MHQSVIYVQRRLQPMDLQTAITAIKQLPHHYFDNNLIFDGCDDFSKYIKGIKYQYKNIGLWLDYYLLGYQELYFELVNNDSKFYKPLGERSSKIYRFLQEIKLLSNILQNENIHQIWYLVEREIFVKTIENSGLYGKPALIGKRKSYEISLQQERQFTDIEKIRLLGKKHTHSAIDLMMSEAITISKIPENAQFREIYRTFSRSMTRCDSLMYKSGVNIAYLKSGKFFYSGDGKRAK